MLANIHEDLGNGITQTLSKAILIHSAILKNGRVSVHELKYYGFGIPDDYSRLLSCPSWMSTLIFEVQMYPGLVYDKWPFPLPNCLKMSNGKYKYDVALTLVYNPPLESAYGSEYCRTNIDVSFGTYDLKQSKIRTWKNKISLMPDNKSLLWERNQIANGFKWSPIKVYYKSIRGTKGDNWRLRIKPTNRRGYYQTEPQDAILIMSLIDPNKEKPVYTEVSRNIINLGWRTRDIIIQERIRTRN